MQVGLEGFLKQVLSVTMLPRPSSKREDSEKGLLSLELKSPIKTVL